MTFASPYLLFALLAVPFAALGYLLLERRRTKRSAAWSKPAMLPNVVRGPSRRLRYVPAGLLLLGMAFLLVGLARPEQTLDTVRTGGAALVVLTFDVSGSMAARDVRPTRIAAARTTAIRFLHELPSRYRVAVITFADKVHVVVPPTFDHEKAIANLPEAVTPLAGTAIGDAINDSVALTVQAVGKSTPGYPYPPGAVLLISDGVQTAVGTKPEDAAQLALVDGIPIDTLAVGTPHGIVVQPAKVNTGQETTRRISVPVDPTSLRTVSVVTGGTFLQPASPSRFAQVYENLGLHSSSGSRRHEFNVAAAAVALVLFVAGAGLSGLWFGRVA